MPPYALVSQHLVTRGREQDIPGGESYAFIFYILQKLSLLGLASKPLGLTTFEGYNN